MWPFGLKQAQLRADVDYLLELEQYKKELERWERYGKQYQKENLRPMKPIRPTIIWKY